MALAGYVRIGRVVKPHALKGEVAVAEATDLPFAYLEGLEVWFVPPRPGVPRSARVVSVRQGPKGPLATFEGIEDLSAADRLRGAELLARESELPEYVAEEELDEVGLRVHDVERGDIGEIVEVIITGANDVWVLEGPFGQVLVPVIDDVVLEVDEEAGIVQVKLLPGLIEESAE